MIVEPPGTGRIHADQNGRAESREAERMRMLFRTLGAADLGFSEPFKDAFRGILDPSLTQAQRLARFDAAGSTVADTLTVLATRASQILPKGKVSEMAQEACPPGSAPRIEWWGGLLSRLPAIAKGLDKVLDDPTHAQKSMRKAAAYLRAAAATETENLSRIGVHIPPERFDEVHGAIIDYSLGLTSLLLRGTVNPEEVGAASGFDESVPAMGVFLARQLLSIDREKLDDETVGGAIQAAASLASKAPGAYKGYQTLAAEGLEEIGRLNEQLRKSLDQIVDLSPEGRAALTELTKDATAAVRFGFHAGQFATVLKRKDLKPSEATVIQPQRAAEGMGIPFVKMLQSVINDDGLRKSMKADGEDMGPVLAQVMTRLQEGVTAMSDAELRAQLHLAFPESNNPDFKDIFVEFNFTPKKAGSFGQVHEAVIRHPQDPNRLVKVAVKVQRPNMEESLAEAVRVVGMAFRAGHAYSVADKDLDPAAAEKLKWKMAFFESLMVAFVNSFRIELDYANEMKEIQVARKDARTHPGVYVHDVFASHTKGPVLSTEWVEGWGLNEYLDCQRAAQEAREAPLVGGALDAAADARGRAELWCRKQLGARPVKLETQTTGTGFDITCSFKDSMISPVLLQIAQDGSLSTQATLPDFEALQDRAKTAREARRIIRTSFVGDFDDPTRQKLEARRRAELWCRQRFGLYPTEVEVEKDDTGFRATAHLDDGDQPTVQLHVTPEGKITSDAKVMDWDLLERRFDRVKVAQTEPMPTEPLNVEQALKWNVELWCRQNYGTRPTSLWSVKDPTGHSVTATFSDSVYHRVKLHVADGTGAITPSDDKKPDLSSDALQQVIGTLTSEFMSKLIFRRRPHGDMTKGNFRIMPDGKTVGILDFGQVLRIRLREFFAPAKMLVGAITQNRKMVASSIIDMSEQSRTLKGAERKATRDRIVTLLEKVDKERANDGFTKPLPTARMAKYRELVGRTTDDVLRVMLDSEARVIPNPLYLQLLKTSWCMFGNLNSVRLALEERGEKIKPMVVAKAMFKTFLKDIAVSWTPFANGQAEKKRKRILEMGGITTWVKGEDPGSAMGWAEMPEVAVPA